MTNYPAGPRSKKRYEVQAEPSDKTWAVYDILTGAPAERDGKPLTGLTKYEAEEAAANLIDDPALWVSAHRA
jgi:hypothetical protein